MKQQHPVGRFAPTPSGRMHLGNVFAALIAWLSVRSADGEMVLRMEDLDTQRTSADFADILRMIYPGWDWTTTGKRHPRVSAARFTTGISRCCRKKG